MTEFRLKKGDGVQSGIFSDFSFWNRCWLVIITCFRIPATQCTKERLKAPATQAIGPSERQTIS